MPALERGLKILECLAESQHGLTLSQITRALDLPKSTVHCLLLTFERCGYVQRDDNGGRYRLGLRLFGMANVALPALAIREQAAPILRALLNRTQLTVHMGALDFDELVLVAKFNPLGMSTPPTWVGKRMDFHCTALGKAVLAYMEEGEIERLIRKHGMLRHNDNTINSLRRLRQDLDLTRRRGYSIDDEEEEIGMRCIGAPVLDAAGHPRAAISIVGTTSVIDADSLPSFAAAVKESAAAIAERLATTEVASPPEPNQAAAGRL